MIFASKSPRNCRHKAPIAKFNQYKISPLEKNNPLNRLKLERKVFLWKIKNQNKLRLLLPRAISRNKAK
jgi:hypothetical protein